MICVLGRTIDGSSVPEGIADRRYPHRVIPGSSRYAVSLPRETVSTADVPGDHIIHHHTGRTGLLEPGQVQGYIPMQYDFMMPKHACIYAVWRFPKGMKLVVRKPREHWL